MIVWKITIEDLDLIREIADRATKLADRLEFFYDPLVAQMDLTACHANGNPLDLPALLAANDGDFGHDVFGICRHINRDTGQLEDCFRPRFSR